MRHAILARLLMFAITLVPLAFRSPQRPVLRRRFAAVRSCVTAVRNCVTDDLDTYWQTHAAAWEQPLRLLDVQAAWNCGELDGILPSGRPSRAAANERLLTLPRAIALFEEGELNVRRRYRNMKAEELQPRWERVAGRRVKLQTDGVWDDIVSKSDEMRRSQRALVDGEAGADASPLSRARARVLSPILGAAERQRSRADGGVSSACLELCTTAGRDAVERWLTAALLADVEAEIAAMPAANGDGDAVKQRSRSSFAEREAERDVEEAQAFGVYGVIAGLIFGATVNYLVVFGGGGDGAGDGLVGTSAEGLQRTLDLLQ